MGRRLLALTRGGLANSLYSDWRITRLYENPYSDVWLNCKKSAEAIVPGGGMSLKEWEYKLNGKG